jgi:glycosyltransferase involved in cell wall biosynthesis
LRILYISQYFPPEAGASQTRAYELARNLVQLGHHVTMLAEIPNHPSGIIPPEYHGRLYERADLDGIDVRRVWVKASPQKTYRSRLAFYTSFMVTAGLAGLFLARGRYDVLYVDSPPLLAGGAGLAISYLRRIPMVFEVCDLWPESAVVLGEMKNPKAISLATKLEEACYRHSHKIVVVTKGIEDRLRQRGVPGEKLALIPNGATTDFFDFSPEAHLRIRTELGLEHKFIAGYAGLHGLAQGLETIVEAARLLLDEPEYHFVLVGAGPTRTQVMALAQQYALQNITFIPEQPRTSIPAYLSAADVALIPLKRVELFEGALPSKLFDAWACRRPVIMSVDGEARQILETVQGGRYSPPEDPQGIVEALHWMKANPALREKMGENGRTYTVQHHSHPSLAKRLADVLQEASRKT